DAPGNCKEPTRQDHPSTNSLMVIYHTGPMMAGSGADTQSVWNGPAVTLRTDGACGVERLTWLGGGMRQMKCGFMEVNGDGIVDYIYSGTRGALANGTPLSHPTLTAADRSCPSGWWFMAGTAVGFAAPRAIVTPAGLPFALHVSRERCDGTSSAVIADLLDI